MRWALRPVKERKNMRLYVGNLSYGTGDEAIKAAFAKYGAVDSAAMVIDRDTGRPKGFAFVDMPIRDQAEAAMRELNGSMLDGRTIRVNEATPRRKDRFGGGRYDRAYGRFGGRHGGMDDRTDGRW